MTPEQDLYENAPCGYIVARPDRSIVRVNATLLALLGYDRKTLTDKPFTDLMAVGSRIHYETHFAPLLQLQGQLAGITVDLVTANGARLPVFLTANVKSDPAGQPILLRITIQDAQDRRSYERELLDERQRVERERARVQVFARTLQRSLLPPLLSPPEGLEASAYYLAASADDVGGDFYDLFPLAHEKWAFFIGDVSGKGAGAAAVTSLTRYTLRAAAVFDADPVAVLHNVHTVLSQEFRDTVNQFATVVFGIITPDDGGFRYSARQRWASSPVTARRRRWGALRGHHRWQSRRNPDGAEIPRGPNSTWSGRHAGSLHGWVDRGANRQRRRPLRLLRSVAGIRRCASADDRIRDRRSDSVAAGQLRLRPG
jgi:PAS domain S-box-containing protein